MTKAIPNVPIFEDTEISKILNKQGVPWRHPLKAVTSAVRFDTNGFLKQSAMNQIFKLGYWVGVPKEKMDLIYEKSLNLNSRR